MTWPYIGRNICILHDLSSRLARRLSLGPAKHWLLMADDNLDELYNDIELYAVNEAKKPEGSSERKPAGVPLSLTEENETLRVQLKKLQQENDNLKRNIGILYRTAKAELERKDAIIQGLEHDLMNRS